MAESTSPEKLLDTKITRRQFLGISLDVLKSLAIFWHFPGGKINLFGRPESDEDTEDIFSRLIKKVKSSNLLEEGAKEIVSKERLLTFIEKVKIAGEYFGQIHHHKEQLEEIESLIRKLYGNPDIPPDSQIFFLRDEAILSGSLLGLDSLDWSLPRKDLEKGAGRILTKPPVAHSKSDWLYPEEEWPTTPENLSRIYGLAGKRKHTSSFKITAEAIKRGLLPEPIEGVERDKLSVDRWSDFVKEVLGQIGNPALGINVRLLPLIEEGSLANVEYDEPSGEATINLRILTPNMPDLNRKKSNRSTIYHENAHTLDILRRIGLVQFFSAPELLDLYRLRLKVAVDTFFPKILSVSLPKNFSGRRIKGSEIEDTHYKEWVIKNIGSLVLAKDDWEALSHIYFTNLWYEALSIGGYFSKPFIELAKIERGITETDHQPFYANWQDFLSGEGGVFKKLISAKKEWGGLLQFIAQKIKERADEFSLIDEDLPGKNSGYWWSSFWHKAVMLVGEDLITKGEAKRYLPPDTYNDWLRRITIVFSDGLVEKFADEISYYLSFKEVGKAPDWLEQIPAVIYYKRIARLSEKFPEYKEVEIEKKMKEIEDRYNIKIRTLKEIYNEAGETWPPSPINPQYLSNFEWDDRRLDMINDFLALLPRDLYYKGDRPVEIVISS